MPDDVAIHGLLEAAQILRPNDMQRRAFRAVDSRVNMLVVAPTGSGKTEAALIPSIAAIQNATKSGISVLYVTPLRALNRNIIGRLERLAAYSGLTAAVRHGDTPASERRKQAAHPPDILITTPESLNILLTSRRGRAMLGGVATVILDEIHAVQGTKRGVYWMTAVDRLVRLSGEFQRVALSATIRPPEKVAEFVGGFRLVGDPGDPQYLPRPVSILSPHIGKQYDLVLRFVREAGEQEGTRSVWEPLVEELKKIIVRNRSTLIFVNSRRFCEMLTLLINQNEEEPLAYAHHGSLSLEIRSEVERRLKAGTLRAIVATHSLELGIDIGSLDEVILIQSPFSISSAIQRAMK